MKSWTTKVNICCSKRRPVEVAWIRLHFGVGWSDFFRIILVRYFLKWCTADSNIFRKGIKVCMASTESTVKKNKIPLNIHRMCENQKLRSDCADMNIMYELKYYKHMSMRAWLYFNTILQLMICSCKKVRQGKTRAAQSHQSLHSCNCRPGYWSEQVCMPKT